MRISDWSSDVCSSDLNGCCRLLPALQVLLRSRSRVLQNIFTPRDTRWRAPPIMSATSGFLMRNLASQSDGLTALAPTEFGSLVTWRCAEGPAPTKEVRTFSLLV